MDRYKSLLCTHAFLHCVVCCIKQYQYIDIRFDNRIKIMIENGCKKYDILNKWNKEFLKWLKGGSNLHKQQK